MNALEEYCRFLDESEYDVHNETEINTGFQQLIATLVEYGDQKLAEHAEVDRQALLLRKSFEQVTDEHNRHRSEGLKWMLSGKRTLEDGTEEDFVWPDYHKFTEQNFNYIWHRYKITKNLFLKTEYGLVAYFTGKPAEARHKDFKLNLCDELTKLAENYLQKAIEGGPDNYYALDFIRTVKGAICIADKEDTIRFNALADRLFAIHQGWDSNRRDSLRITLDLPSTLLQYKKGKQRTDFGQVLEKNRESALTRAKEDSWQAIYIADASLRIQKKTQIIIDFNWIRFKAEQYEVLAQEAKSRSGFGALRFYEEALALYNQLGDIEKADNVAEKYKDLRGLPTLNQISQQIPYEHIQPVIDEIKRVAAEESPDVIFDAIMFGKTFNSLEGIRRSEEMIRETSVLLKMMPMTVLDKYGNPSAHYGVEDEYGSLFWQAYDYDFQIGFQNLTLLFWKAYHAKKITFETTRTILENSWLNEPIERVYSGHTIQIRPIEIVLPPIKAMFEEFNAHHASDQHQTNLLVVFDSLALKVEALIRYFFDKIGMKTFRHNSKRGVMQEKNLDELLSELRFIQYEPNNPDVQAYFSEADRLFIRYIMTEKVGLNLRNRVAHGLLDGLEYHHYAADWLILVYSIIVRLCKYQFKETHDTDNQQKSA